MSADKIRHQVLEDIVSEFRKQNLPITFALDTLVLFDPPKANFSEYKKAFFYLLSDEYLAYSPDTAFIDNAGVAQERDFVMLTKKGRNALHSDYFLERHKDKIQSRNNNRWMISCNIVVALGVVYGIASNSDKIRLQLSLNQQKLPLIDTVLNAKQNPRIEIRVESDSLAKILRDSTP